MAWLDIVLIVWLTVSLISGVRAGFVYKLGTLIGFVVGIWLASRWTPQLAPTFGEGPWTTAIVFLVLLSIVTKLFGLVAWLVDKLFTVVSIIPFLKTFNRVLGGLLSVLITIFIISSVAFVADTFSRGGVVSQSIGDSVVASNLMPLSIFYAPLLADSLDDYVGGFSDKPVEEEELPVDDFESVVEDVVEEPVIEEETDSTPIIEDIEPLAI